MSASTIGPESREGAIRVIPEAHDIVAVCLEGEFDLTNAPFLAEEIERALESASGLILALSDATFIDSSVIPVLVRTSEAARGRDQTMVLQLGTAAVVERVLEISAVERVLRRAHDRQEAVRIVQSSRHM